MSDANIINALCSGGPIHGGSISFAAPPVGQGVVRGASFVLIIDETSHQYSLAPTSLGQEWQYRGVTVKAPTDIVDR